MDCVGSILALKNNLKFLTGGEKFENKENVEFVKVELIKLYKNTRKIQEKYENPNQYLHLNI